MLENVIKEVAIKELKNATTEVIEKKMLLHSQFSSKKKAIDGVFSKKPIQINFNAEKNIRDLTEIDKMTLKEKLGWSDDQLKKCAIDENGIVQYRTDRCDLEGKRHEPSGVLYERKQICIDGIKIEGVFPVFDSKYDTYLPPDKYKSNTYATECNAKLKEAIEQNPELRKSFTLEQIKDIESGDTPDGYVWHHNEEQGKMQLVEKIKHDKTIGGAPHTGGSALWGPASDNVVIKGEKF